MAFKLTKLERDERDHLLKKLKLQAVDGAWNHVRNNVNIKVWADVCANVGNAVGDKVTHNVVNNVWANIKINVETKVWTKVWTNVTNIWHNGVTFLWRSRPLK